MAFLVTGGAGFIGSKLVNVLNKNGYQVRVLDNFSTGDINNLKNTEEIEIIRGDVRDFQTCARAVKDIDCVFHLAAIASISRSLSDPLTCSEVNAGGTINIMEAARNSKVSRVIISSTSAVYGNAKSLPNREDDLSRPLSPYGISKYAAESYAKYYSNTYGLETVILRYFNVFGPGRFITSESESCDVISKFIKNLLMGKEPVIFGTGSQTRDFIFIDNVIKANLLAYSSKKVGKGEVINIGSGSSISINELCNKLNKIMNLNMKPRYISARPGEIKATRAGIEKAVKLLSYTVDVEFIEGLINTYHWYKANMTNDFHDGKKNVINLDTE